MIERRLGSGLWVAVHPGVYRIGGSPETWEQRMLAACLATGGVASHRSAARLWALDLRATELVEVTVGGTNRRHLSGGRLHNARSVSRAVRNGIPCSSAARTLLDLAALLTAADLEAALDSALRDGHVSVPHLQARLTSQGRKGAGTLRELVADRADQRPHDSRREADVARMLVALGLPRPVRQYELRAADGTVLARFDLAWPDRSIALEFVSYRHHFGRRAWRADTSRLNRAAAAGWIVFNVTEDDVGDGCRSLATDVRRARAA